MKQDTFKNDWQRNLNPLLDAFQDQTQTCEKLVALQADYLNESLRLCFDQFKAMIETRDPQKLMELQEDYIKEMEQKFADVLSQELSLTSSAQDSFNKLMRKIYDSEVEYIESLGGGLSDSEKAPKH